MTTLARTKARAELAMECGEIVIRGTVEDAVSVCARIACKPGWRASQKRVGKGRYRIRARKVEK